MNYLFVILIILSQLNFFYLSPSSGLNKTNLKNSQKVQKGKLREKERKRELDDLSDDIVIIHLNDVHCGLNDTIGYDGFVLYRNELEKNYRYVITVDVGDHSQGGALGSITEGEAIINIMNKINFDVVTIGNHEFDYGVEQLNKLNELSNTKYISLNACYNTNKERLFSPSKIIEIGEKKIGFLGVVTPLTYSKTYLSNLKDSDGTPMYYFISDKEELYKAIQDEVDNLRNNQNVNYVILLTHVGIDKEEYTSNEILSNVQDIDAVLDGHTHKEYAITTKDKTNKDIPITQSGTKLAYIGKLIIKEDGTLINENIAEVPEPDDNDIRINAIKVNRGGGEKWVDKNMNDAINEIYYQYEDELNAKFGYLNFDFNVTSSEENAPYPITCRYQECNLGNFLADAFVEIVSADLSIVNGGNIRTNLLKGDITRKNLIDVSPFFNSIFVKEVTGEAILNALEFGVSNLPRASGGFPQVSGCTYYVDTSIESTVVKDANGMFLRVGGERRVSNVKIKGEALDLNKKYNLSAAEFILDGGDGYTMFKDFPIVNESVLSDSDVLGYYIKNELGGEIPSHYQELKNRINIDIKPDDNEDKNKTPSLSECLKIKYIHLLLIIFIFV